MSNAIVINPSAKTIEAVDCKLDDIHDMYRLIGCECFDAVHMQIGSLRVTGWVDDEGGLRPNDYLVVAGRHLAGNVLLTGPANQEGDMLPLPRAITPDVVREVVQWTDTPIPVGFRVYTWKE